MAATARILGISDDQIGRYLVRFDLVEYRDRVRASFGYRKGLWRSDQIRIGVHPG